MRESDNNVSIMTKKGIARLITRFSTPEIKKLFAHAHTVCVSKMFDIRRAKGIHEYGRVLIVIPRNVGTAVERNRIRRRLKSIFYQQKIYHHGYDYLIFVKPPAATASYQEIKNDLPF